MIGRSFRIDDDMLTKILDSGDAAIKVFRYVKSHTNSQNNKVQIKSSEVIRYLKTYNILCDASKVSKGIKTLTDLNFIIKCNTLSIYKSDANNMYLVNPNYCVISNPDTIFRRIQSDERIKHDYEEIVRRDEERIKREESVIKIKMHKSKTNGSKS